MSLPELVIDAILKHMPPNQIDDLRFQNRRFRDIIRARRHHYPCTPIREVQTWKKKNGEIVVYSDISKEGNDQSWVLMDNEKLKTQLSYVTAKKFVVYNPSNYEHFDPRWIAKIDHIHIEDKKGLEPITGLLSRTRCRTLCIFSKMEVKADEVLGAMREVKELILYGVSIGSDFMEKLSSRTNLETGIEYFEFQSYKKNRLDAQGLLHFIKNAKFAPRPRPSYPPANGDTSPFVYAKYVTGSQEEFTRDLEQWGRKTNKLFTIISEFSPLIFTIGNSELSIRVMFKEFERD